VDNSEREIKIPLANLLCSMPTPPDSAIDCLIAGAGPVGLTLALELQRFGLKCLIIDQNAAPTDKSKALVLWPRSLELLDRAGIAGDFVAAGMWAKGARMFGDGRQLAHIEIYREDSAFHTALMIAQNETERILNLTLQRRGLFVERSITLVKCIEQGNSVASTLRHADGREEIVTSAWLGGCDGSHSTVRKQLGIEFTGEFEPNDWILADVQIDGPIAFDEITAFWHSDGIAVFFPIAPGRCRVIADMGKAPGTEKPADPTLEQVQAIVDRRTAIKVRLHDPIWLSGFRIHERKVDQYSRGRVFLCGDAAHIHSPAGGQGMNTGMQDAFNLAWKLALVHLGRARSAPLLDSYSIERDAVGKMVLKNAGTFTSMAMIRNPLLQFLRNNLIAIATKFSAVQQRAIATLTETAVHYPVSPLNAEDPGPAWHGDLNAGDRLPDADLLDRAGRATRLLTVVGGSKHSVLLIPAIGDSVFPALLEQARRVLAAFSQTVQLILVLPNQPSVQLPADLSVVIDHKSQVRDRLGLRATALALIRPDGYIGLRGHTGSLPKLQHHLESYLLPG
jgi:2-polyprenyl-6-methoxyphenol hydroxylase-like FAD-dependent oxidoreductase